MLFEKNLTDLCMLYCVTSLHAGAGQSVGAVDLPIQRERHTAWPMVQASGVKGAFRDWFERYYSVNPENGCANAPSQAKELSKKVFGREEAGGKRWRSRGCDRRDRRPHSAVSGAIERCSFCVGDLPCSFVPLCQRPEVDFDERYNTGGYGH